MIFERKEDETDEQWNAFLAYRDAGVSRTVTGLAQQLGISRKTVQRYSKRHNWERRIAAYDSWKVTQEVRDKAEIIAQDTLSQLDVVIKDLIQITKSEVAYKKKLWADYWRDIRDGVDPKTKPPASSTRSIGDLIQSISEVSIKIREATESPDESVAAIDQLIESLKDDAESAET